MEIDEIRQRAKRKLSADDYRKMSVSEIAQIRMDVKRLLRELDALRAQQEQPNETLTLDELRKMDGEPVWVCTGSGENGWCVVAVDGESVFLHGPEFESFFEPDPDFYNMKFNDPDGHFGLHVLGWLAYRRKPELEE